MTTEVALITRQCIYENEWEFPIKVCVRCELLSPSPVSKEVDKNIYSHCLEFRVEFVEASNKIDHLFTFLKSVTLTNLSMTCKNVKLTGISVSV